MDIVVSADRSDLRAEAGSIMLNMAGKKGKKTAGASDVPAKKLSTLLPPSQSQNNLTFLLQATPSELPGLSLADLQEDEDFEEATLEELLDEARDLPQQPSALWVVATRQLTGVPLPHPDTGKLVDPWLIIVLDALTGEMLFAEPHPLPSNEQIAEALVLCMLEPNDGSAPLRPARILTEDGPLALSLHMMLARLGVKVERQDLPGLNEALAQMVGALEGHLGEELSGPQAPVFLAGLPADETEALVVAFRRFLAAEPWEVFSGRKAVYVSWNATAHREAGQFYATLMGLAGQEFGLSLYPDWVTYALHLYNFSAFDVQQGLDATGGTEALMLSDPDILHPDDLATLYAAGADPQSLPGLLRIGPDGPLTPLTPVALLPLVLEMLAERAEGRRSPVTTLNSERDGVRVRYPAGPRDELTVAERAGSVRVVMAYAPSLAGQPAGEVVLSGPADMLFRKAMGGLRAWLDERDIRINPPFRLNLMATESGAGGEPEDALEPPMIWESRAELPDLTLAHLGRMVRVQDTWFCDLTAEWQPGKLDALSIVSDFKPGKKATKKRSGP